MSLRINILGTDYEIFYDLDSNEADGETNFFSKEIHVRPIEKLLDDDATDYERAEWANHVILHEIVHAFFYESGLRDYAYDETLVDWVASQFYKIRDAVNGIEG